MDDILHPYAGTRGHGYPFYLCGFEAAMGRGATAYTPRRSQFLVGYCVDVSSVGYTSAFAAAVYGICGRSCFSSLLSAVFRVGDALGCSMNPLSHFMLACS